MVIPYVLPCIYILVDIALGKKLNAIEIFKAWTENGFIDGAGTDPFDCTCPVCGGPVLIKHSGYKRHLKCMDPLGHLTEKLIEIERMLCLACSHTHAELPDCIIPYSQYSLPLTLSVIYTVKKAEEQCRGTGDWTKYTKEMSDIQDRLKLTESQIDKMLKCYDRDVSLIPGLVQTEDMSVDDVFTFICSGISSYRTRKSRSREVKLTGMSAFLCAFYEKNGYHFLQPSHLKPACAPVCPLKACLDYWAEKGTPLQKGLRISLAWVNQCLDSACAAAVLHGSQDAPGAVTVTASAAPGGFSSGSP